MKTWSDQLQFWPKVSKNEFVFHGIFSWPKCQKARNCRLFEAKERFESGVLVGQKSYPKSAKTTLTLAYGFQKVYKQKAIWAATVKEKWQKSVHFFDFSIGPELAPEMALKPRYIKEKCPWKMWHDRTNSSNPHFVLLKLAKMGTFPYISMLLEPFINLDEKCQKCRLSS